MSARLVPSVMVRDALVAAVATRVAEDPGVVRWLRHSSAAIWLPAPADSDWNHIHRTVMVGANILGYACASVDRDTCTVTEVAVFATVPSVAFSRAVRGFMMDLRQTFRAVRWSCVAGSPAETMSRRLDGRYGIRVAGRFTAGAMLHNSPADVTIFEMTPEGA